MCITGLQFGIHLDRFGPNFSPTQRKLGPSWPGAKLGPTNANFAYSMRHAENLFFTAISKYFKYFWSLMRVRAPAPLGLSWASAPDAPTADQVAHAKPNLRPKVPKLRHVGPQVGSKLEPTGPSSAQVTPKLGPSGLPFGPT